MYFRWKLVFFSDIASSFGSVHNFTWAGTHTQCDFRICAIKPKNSSWNWPKRVREPKKHRVCVDYVLTLFANVAVATTTITCLQITSVARWLFITVHRQFGHSWWRGYWIIIYIDARSSTYLNTFGGACTPVCPLRPSTAWSEPKWRCKKKGKKNKMKLKIIRMSLWCVFKFSKFSINELQYIPITNRNSSSKVDREHWIHEMQYKTKRQIKGGEERNENGEMRPNRYNAVRPMPIKWKHKAILNKITASKICSATSNVFNYFIICSILLPSDGRVCAASILIGRLFLWVLCRWPARMRDRIRNSPCFQTIWLINRFEWLCVNVVRCRLSHFSLDNIVHSTWRRIVIEENVSVDMIAQTNSQRPRSTLLLAN